MTTTLEETTAVTPNAKHHANLPPMATRFVNIGDLPWEKTRFPGVETKTLLVDKKSGLLTVLLKMAPGAQLPDHEHVLIEQTYVIEGRLVCGEGEVTAGNYSWRPAGSRHTAGTPEGGLMLAMFLVPNRFFEADGSTADLLGQDWDSHWGHVLFN
jgi:anti-sigma factor ChrR (cupin superfamily)